MIGHRFDDNTVQENIRNWLFHFVNLGRKPSIGVEYRGEQNRLNAEDVSSIALVKMKETVETFLGDPVTDAVLTVPAYFNGGQRQATKDFGTIFGMNMLQIVNEPTTAVVAYGSDIKVGAERNVSILNLVVTPSMSRSYLLKMIFRSENNCW